MSAFFLQLHQVHKRPEHTADQKQKPDMRLKVQNSAAFLLIKVRRNLHMVPFTNTIVQKSAQRRTDNPAYIPVVHGRLRRILIRHQDLKVQTRHHQMRK